MNYNQNIYPQRLPSFQNDPNNQFQNLLPPQVIKFFQENPHYSNYLQYSNNNVYFSNQNNFPTPQITQNNFSNNNSFILNQPLSTKNIYINNNKNELDEKKIITPIYNNNNLENKEKMKKTILTKVQIPKKIKPKVQIPIKIKPLDLPLANFDTDLSSEDTDWINTNL